MLAAVKRDGMEARGEEWGIEAEEAFKDPIRAQYEEQGSPYYSTARLWDDGIIDPLDTRRVLGMALELPRRHPSRSPLTESSGCSDVSDRFDRESRRDRCPHCPHLPSDGLANGLRFYTPADRDLVRAYSTDEAVEVSSYLAAEDILAAARHTGADAIHPGYGFVSENPMFARSVTAAGLVWIGPSAEAMEAMSRKDTGRAIAAAAGVPVTLRYEPGAIPEEAYPVLVKAAAGGGGKGMHIVRSASDIDDALAMAAGEAPSIVR